MGIIPSPGRLVGGSVGWRGTDLTQLSEKKLRDIRGGEISMVFQDPMTHLNPVLKIGEQIAEAIKMHRQTDGVRDATVDALNMVGIPAPFEVANSYPHQLSGGMRQRVLISMALACRPSLLIAD